MRTEETFHKPQTHIVGLEKKRTRLGTPTVNTATRERFQKLHVFSTLRITTQGLVNMQHKRRITLGALYGSNFSKLAVIMLHIRLIVVMGG
jgi:hypothetical protein